MVVAQSLIHQVRLSIDAGGRGTTDVTDRVASVVAASGVSTGLVHVFIQHTSASLMICENADPDVRADLERFFAGLVSDGDARFEHRCEGADDMSAHVRSVLTHTDLTLPVTDGRMALGTWQGIYLWEHRYRAYQRRIVVTVSGTPDRTGAGS